jgi:superfamily II DNA/RNA helicase
MRTQFNLFWEQDVPKSKSGEILLASAAWQHYKSKGDHFIIHPIKELASDMSEKSFEELNIDEKIIANIKQQDIIKQTKVQEQAIPLIMKNEHVLLAAETGSGKTHTFLVPIIQRILGMKHKVNREFNTPLALIITPGRELATQIGHMAEALCDGLGLNVKVVLGGRTKQQMLNPSFEDIDILIGSLGGISKLTTTGIYHMKEVRHVVLDESDTLLDDSFMEKLSYFLRRFPVILVVNLNTELLINILHQFHRNLLNSDSQVGTQLILASATMPTNTEELFQSIIDPETIKTVVSQNLHRILPNVTQK